MKRDSVQRRAERSIRSCDRPGSAYPAGPPGPGAGGSDRSGARAAARRIGGRKVRPSRERTSGDRLTGPRGAPWRDRRRRRIGRAASASRSRFVGRLAAAHGSDRVVTVVESRCRAAHSTMAQYSLIRPSLLELRDEPAGGFGRLGPDQDPGGRPVQPVDDPQVDRAGIGRIEIADGPPFPASSRPAAPKSPG